MSATYCNLNVVNASLGPRFFLISAVVPTQDLAPDVMPALSGVDSRTEPLAPAFHGWRGFRVSALVEVSSFFYGKIPVELVPAEPRPERISQNAIGFPASAGFHDRLRVEPWVHLPIASFWWHYRWSDPTVPDLIKTLASGIVQDCGALVVAPDFMERKGLAVFGARRSWLQLLAPGTVLGDGQGILVRGRIARLDEADADAALRNATSLDPAQLRVARTPVWAIADNWDKCPPPPFRALGLMPPWLDSAKLSNWCRGEAVRARQRAENNPFYEPKYSHQSGSPNTGDHFDFSVNLGLGVWAAMASGDPAMLDVLLCDAAQQACRPMSFIERDSAPYRKRNHPQAWFSGGRQYQDLSYSPDQLGKPAPWMPGQPNPGQHGWTADDTEHWSINHLVGTYLLTGDPGLRWLLEDNAEAIKSNLNEGTIYTYLGNPRAVGRMLLTAAQLYCALGDPDLLAWMRGWVGTFERIWLGAQVPVDPTKVHVMKVDGSWIPGKLAWNGYEHGFVVTGLYAMHLATGDADALAMAKLIAETLVRYAWRETVPGFWALGRIVEWVPNGEPPDPATTEWRNVGDDFADNGIAAVILAERWGILPDRCRAIRASVESRRRPGDGYGGPDRYCSWASI